MTRTEKNKPESELRRKGIPHVPVNKRHRNCMNISRCVKCNVDLYGVVVINLKVIIRLGLKYVEWYIVQDHLARNHAHPFIYGDTANHIHNLLYIVGCVRMNPKYRE